MAVVCNSTLMLLHNQNVIVDDSPLIQNVILHEEISHVWGTCERALTQGTMYNRPICPEGYKKTCTHTIGRSISVWCRHCANWLNMLWVSLTSMWEEGHIIMRELNCLHKQSIHEHDEWHVNKCDIAPIMWLDHITLWRFGDMTTEWTWCGQSD